MIPRVRTWRARFWLGDGIIKVIDVQAPTRMLASMALRDAPGYLDAWKVAESVTFGPRRAT